MTGSSERSIIMRVDVPDPHLMELFERIHSSEEEMVGFLAELVHMPAIGPLSGGEGEWKKARLIETYLRKWNVGEILHHDAPDETVPEGSRPNIEIRVRGKRSGNRIVVIAHMDVVPPGDPASWSSDPFTLKIEDGRAIGRGVEDNGQSIVASIFALKTMMDLRIEPPYDLSLFLVSDEEETNRKGIGHLLKEGLLGKGDLILVPDHGEPNGRLIELCEKTLLWVKIKVTGKQCHASMPHLGNNALRASMIYGSRLDAQIHKRFDRSDASFDHPLSSFEPTKRESGLDGINILPGEDVFYLDCRLLPDYSTDEVIAEMHRVAREVEAETGTTIDIETVLSETTIRPTLPNSSIVRMLTNAIQLVSHRIPYTGGIGGGTCAALIRNAGFDVAVWETILNRAHSPNEYIEIENLLNDCKVMATLFSSPTD